MTHGTLENRQSIKMTKHGFLRYTLHAIPAESVLGLQPVQPAGPLSMQTVSTKRLGAPGFSFAGQEFALPETILGVRLPDLQTESDPPASSVLQRRLAVLGFPLTDFRPAKK